MVSILPFQHASYSHKCSYKLYHLSCSYPFHVSPVSMNKNVTTNLRHYVAVYFVKQLGGILPKALVSVVKYGCMYQYKVGGVSQKKLVRQLPGSCYTYLNNWLI